MVAYLIILFQSAVLLLSGTVLLLCWAWVMENFDS